MATPALIGLEEAARTISVPLSWFRKNLYKLKGVEVVKVGKYRRLRMDQFEKWIEGGCPLKRHD